MEYFKTGESTGKKKSVTTRRIKIRIIRKIQTIALNQDSSQPETIVKNISHSNLKSVRKQGLISIGLCITKFIFLIYKVTRLRRIFSKILI